MRLEVQNQNGSMGSVWWDFFSWLAGVSLFKVSYHGLSSVQVHRGCSHVSSSSFKDTNPIVRGCPHPNLITFQRLHLQITSHWKLGLSHSNGRRHKHPVHNATYNDHSSNAWPLLPTILMTHDFLPSDYKLPCYLPHLRQLTENSYISFLHWPLLWKLYGTVYNENVFFSLIPVLFAHHLTSQSEETRCESIRTDVDWIDLWRTEWSYSLYIGQKGR